MQPIFPPKALLPFYLKTCKPIQKPHANSTQKPLQKSLCSHLSTHNITSLLTPPSSFPTAPPPHKNQKETHTKPHKKLRGHFPHLSTLTIDPRQYSFCALIVFPNPFISVPATSPLIASIGQLHPVSFATIPHHLHKSFTTIHCYFLFYTMSLHKPLLINQSSNICMLAPSVCNDMNQIFTPCPELHRSLSIAKE